MTSILTNNGAMVALQTLKGINNQLGTVQEQISTGKKVGTASDNAATWAISKTMEADVSSFGKISEGLAVGKSTVAVARDASETVTDLLTQMKEKIVQSQSSSNADDREKIQADITALREQVGSVVGSAQFNGVNLLNGTSSEDLKILSSLDRDANGDVNASHIKVERQNLSPTLTEGSAADFGNGTAVATMVTNADGTADIADGTSAQTVDGSAPKTFKIAGVEDGASYRIVLDDTDATNGLNSLGKRTFEYVANSDDSASSVAANLQTQIANYLSATGENNYEVTRTDNGLTFTSKATDTTKELSVTFTGELGGTAGVNPGGLGNLQNIDVTTEVGATSALTAIDEMIKLSVDAAAVFGTAQNQLETQSDFVSKLSDNLKAGIGSMVDADMEEASARLKALQTQQQLGVQSLSIANQAPQSVMALFR